MIHPDDIPPEVIAALRQAYDPRHDEMSADPLRAVHLAQVVWDWLAAGADPIVDVTGESESEAA